MGVLPPPALSRGDWLADAGEDTAALA